MSKDKDETWIKKNIFSIISLIVMLCGLIASIAVERYQLQEARNDIAKLEKDVKELKGFGNVSDMRKVIDDKIFAMKTDLYKEVEKLEVLFMEKFRNSERREQEFRQDLKEIQRALRRIR